MKIVAKNQIESGQEFNFYSPMGKAEVGREYNIFDVIGNIVGKALCIGRHADDPKYHDKELCGGRKINSGEGWFRMKVE